MIARARVRLRLSREESLTISPAEMEELFEQDIELRHEAVYPAALICSVIANVHRNSEARSEPFTPSDFMPVTEKELIEQEEAANRTPTPEEVEAWKQGLHSLFRKKS
jgi:hypothetical protein